MMRDLYRLMLATFCCKVVAAAHAAFDHSHRAWTVLLGKHVVLVDGGKASQVDYAAFARDRAALDAYRGGLSSVAANDFEGWTRAEQLAFLINAYNAFTIEVILRSYPNVKSIRDLGGFLAGGPWKTKFFALLGREQSLDGIEHDTIRSPGAFEVSQIFQWYKEDFERGHRGFDSVPKTLGRYADLLADGDAERALVRNGTAPIRYLSYDWTLNDVRGR